MTHRRDGTTQMKQAQENEVGSSHRRIEQDWEAWRDPKVGCHQPPSPHNTLGLCEGAALTVGQARSKPLRERSRDGGRQTQQGNNRDTQRKRQRRANFKKQEQRENSQSHRRDNQ